MCVHVQVALGLQIVKFSETLEDMFTDLAPNRLTEYVYELANLFSSFYTECKVIHVSCLTMSAKVLCILLQIGNPIAYSPKGIHMAVCSPNYGEAEYPYTQSAAQKHDV